MFVKFLVTIVIALFWLDDLGRRHGVLGRSVVRHGISPAALMAVSSDDGKAPRRDTHHWAGYVTVEGEYYGTVARINTWGLKLKPGQISSSVVWLSSDGGNNQIMAGFKISPDTYNDTDLHFFVSWTADGFNTTGCLDTNCQGFVPSSTPAASLSPGSTVAQLSVYHGKQTDYTITIQKVARNWWLYVDVSGRQEPIGHFPASLFTGGAALADHATVVGWGGSAQSSSSSGGGVASSPSPPMGSGHGPREALGGSAYMASTGVVDARGKSSAPAAANVTSLAAGDAHDECGYDASVFGVTHDDDAFFYYGGPGGCHH